MRMMCSSAALWWPGANPILPSVDRICFLPAQAADVVRLLGRGTLVMEQDDLEITDLAGIPGLQQKMLDGVMKKPKGVALVQADRPGRTIADYESAFRGEEVMAADPAENRLIDVRLIKGVAVVTLTRPEALNALNDALVSQLKRSGPGGRGASDHFQAAGKGPGYHRGRAVLCGRGGCECLSRQPGNHRGLCP